MRQLFHNIHMFLEGRRIWKEKKSEPLYPVILDIEDTGWYVLTDNATGIASQGQSLDEALDNLDEALELYFSDDLGREGDKGR